MGDNVATIIGDGSSAGYITQDNVFQSNKVYKCVFDVTINSGLGLKFQDGLSYSTHNENIGFATTSGVYTFYFNSTSYNQLAIVRRTGGTAYDSTINSISIKEVGQNWTFGTGWSMGDGKAVFDTDDGDGTFQSTDILTLNNTYRITFDVNITDGVLRFESGAGNNFLVSSSGTYTHEFEADLLAVKFRRNSTPTRGYIDNISVKEITDATDLPRLNYDDITWQDALSDELITNGGFYTDSGWTKGTGWSIEDGKAVAVSGTASKLVQDISGLNGKYCKVSFTLSNYGGSGSVKVDFGTEISDAIHTNGFHEVFGTYDINRFELYKNGGFEGSIDNVSVKEFTGQEVASSGCPSLLLESQSTNTATYSNDFTQGDIFNGSSAPSLNTSVLTSEQGIAPDGTNTAQKLTDKMMEELGL